jgi:hypothetical protein
MISLTAAGREVLARGSAVHTQTISELLLDRLVFWPSGDRERQSRIWAEEVVPAAREALHDPAGA